MVTVLVVDDSKLARIIMGKAITSLQPDWTRVEASNADDAMAIVDSRHIDIAIIDFNMPGQDGLALAQTLRARFPALPIAIATANVQDEVVTRARAVNASFIAKPATEENLRGFLSGAALRLRSPAE